MPLDALSFRESVSRGMCYMENNGNLHNSVLLTDTIQAFLSLLSLDLFTFKHNKASAMFRDLGALALFI